MDPKPGFRPEYKTLISLMAMHDTTCYWLIQTKDQPIHLSDDFELKLKRGNNPCLC